MKGNSFMGWIIFYGALFSIGAILAYFAFSEYSKTQTLLHKGIKTTATVKNFVTSNSNDGTMYAPIFEFKDRQQNSHIFESGISSKPPAYKIGEKVKIIYNPLNKEKVKTISFWGLYRGSVILFMIAAPFLILGGSYLLYMSK